MPMPLMGRLPGEYTKVGLETEVKIPWETYKKLLILGPVSIWFLVWIPGWLLQLKAATADMSQWRWLSREWWPWFSGGGWIWPILMCSVWCGSAPTWETIRRYFIETRYKRTPEYMSWDPKDGPWDPQAHRRLLREEEWDDEPAGLYAVEGKLEPRNGSALYLKFDLEGYDAARKWHNFCKAVHNKGRNFSYTEAVKRHHLSDDDWTNIYGAFTAQHWAIPCGRRGTPELWGMGRSWVRMFAETPPTPPPA